MPEFDLHDGLHLEKVSENIAFIIGEEKLNSLSSAELMLLELSSYLHDCGTAPADFELNLMKLTEGSELYTLNVKSLRNDGKRPLSVIEAKEFVCNNFADIYGSFDCVQNREFSFRNEEELHAYLAETLIEYQNPQSVKLMENLLITFVL